VLGLLQRDATEFLQRPQDAGARLAGAATGDGAGSAASPAYSPERIAALIQERAAAKKGRNYAEADRIRKDLLDAGVVLEDTPQGTTWRRA